MLKFRRRSDAASSNPPALDDACHRCGTAIRADERAVEATSIVEGVERAIFHKACAPSTDNVRWQRLRDVPMTVVRTDASGD